MTTLIKYILNIAIFTCLFFCDLCTVCAKPRFWSKLKTSENINYDYLINFLEDKAIFINHKDSINVRNKLKNTIIYNEKVLSEKVNIQKICENSSLKLFQEHLIDSKTYSNEMSTLRESINVWEENIRKIKDSDDLNTLDKFLDFINYIKSRIFEIEFCINLLINLRDDFEGKFKSDLNIGRKREVCVKLYNEVHNKLNEKFSENLVGGLGSEGSEMREMFELIINSINQELNDYVTRINSYNYVFSLILFLNEYKTKLEGYDELKRNLEFDELIGKNQVEKVVNINLNDKFLDLYPYLPFDTVFVTSPLSKLVFQELLKAKKLLEDISHCKRYEHISLPLRKKLIFMIKSAGNVLTSYENNYQKLHSVIDTVNEVRLIFDNCIINLCTYDIGNNTELIQKNGIKEIIEFPYKQSFKILSPKESRMILENGFSIGNRNNRGLPYFPETRKDKYTKNNKKFSLYDIKYLLGVINMSFNEIQNTREYIENSTNAILTSLEKIKFTNRIYSEIIESCLNRDLVPASIYSHSYLLYLEIVMYIKKSKTREVKSEKNKTLKSKLSKKSDIQILHDYIDIDSKNKLIEKSDELLSKVLDAISVLRLSIYEKKNGRGFGKLKTKLPSVSKKLQTQVVTPLEGTEEYVSNVKKSMDETVAKMNSIEEKIVKVTRNIDSQEENNSGNNLNVDMEKYLKPLNLIMKCYVEKESSKNYERCKDILIQARELLKYIDRLFQGNKNDVKERENISDKSRRQVMNFVKEWNDSLSLIKNIITIYNDQISTINELDGSLRIILG
ncbi:hypothetical protein FG386_001229 [Cryptosporidium ryanae]|uniref:uncharacterized protein n=1 Tax=Cryptosporidium ryanae TaxID=515981 RepID=UPI003519DD62|nr:hypothetical protein FG386_001229 [Cryptosporidium ryanae]